MCLESYLEPGFLLPVSKNLEELVFVISLSEVKRTELVGNVTTVLKIYRFLAVL